MSILLDGTLGITTPGLTNTGTETLVNLTTTGNTTLGDASGDTLTVTGGTTTFTQGTANGVAYLNGSKVLTTGSALVFDGTNLGIGTTSPSTYGKFVAYSSGGYFSVDTSGQVISAQLLDTATAGGRFTGYSSRGALGAIHIEQTTTSADGGYMAFRTCASGSTSTTERARIDSSGNLLVGTTSSKSKTTIQGQLSVGQTGSASSAAGIYLYASDTLSDNSFLCRVSNGTGTTTWYIGNQAITTSSDIRLKENVKPSERNAIDLLNQWEIIDHTWNDPSDQCENNRNSRGVWTGISAQQVQQVTPWLVNKPTEDVNEDGSINPWTMDFGYAVPLLVKAIQEQQALITTLTDRITALEAK